MQTRKQTVSQSVRGCDAIAVLPGGGFATRSCGAIGIAHAGSDTSPADAVSVQDCCEDRSRADEAPSRRDEPGRLFDLSRASLITLTADRTGTIAHGSRQATAFLLLPGVVDEIGGAGAPVFLDEVHEAPDWRRLVRALLDQGRVTCVTGSNASLLGREVGTRLTGRNRLENAVAVHLRQGTPALSYAGERGVWECDFITPDAAIQVCMKLTPTNRNRELRGAVEGARLRGRRRGLVVTPDKADRLVEDGVAIDVVPAWRWME